MAEVDERHDIDSGFVYDVVAQHKCLVFYRPGYSYRNAISLLAPYMNLTNTMEYLAN